MPPGKATLRHALLYLFLVSLVVAAQQQQPTQQQEPPELQDVFVHSSTARGQHYKRSFTDQLRKGKDTRAIITNNERALATFAPDDIQSVVARPARSSGNPNDLSRQTARSLQDWQVEDIILLATVDGKIYARERYTGAPRWDLEVDRPMVQTTYHNNQSAGEAIDDDLLWVVEPSQDGALYVYGRTGMQRLAMTVKQLVDQFAPWATDDPPVVYTADKKNTLYTIDAATGQILKVFSSAGSVVNTDRSCRKVNALESLDDQECEPMGTLTLGRTEYTVGVQDRDSGEPICTISYFEWSPNNRDRDLQIQYATTLDDRYIYSKHDGGILAVQHNKPDHQAGRTESKPEYSHSLLYSSKLTSPVARVYDVVRPNPEESEAIGASLVVLPQPVGPVSEEWPAPDSVFVNCTEGGSLYALSEQNYPLVTDGASQAMCYKDDFYSRPSTDGKTLCDGERAKLVGVHPLFAMDSDMKGFPATGPHGFPSIDGSNPNRPLIAPPERTLGDVDNLGGFTAGAWQSTLPSPITILLIILGLVAFPQPRAHLLNAWKVITKTKEQRMPMKALPDQTEKTEPASIPSVDEVVVPTDEERKVRFPEPAEETIFPAAEAEDAPDEERSDSQTRDPSPDSSVEADRGRRASQAGAETSPAKEEKKKARRGVRGGRKLKEKKLEQEQAQQRKRNSSQSKNRESESKTPEDSTQSSDQKAQIISVGASESPDVSGKLQINNLIINTDRLIGRGSAGTCVYEGTFDRREVAVKRMLSQYYELASQEVVFLQENDNHANIVRYYCQEKDQNFLYIAVELCQASLWDLFYPNYVEPEKRDQNAEILRAIQRDVPHALHQIVLGLRHLHSQRIIHRDIKPQNILIARPSPNVDGPRLLISDFGLCKSLPENVSTLIDPTNNAGTSGWKAPELISQPKDVISLNGHSSSAMSDSGTGGNLGGVKRAADIFSLGCLFFWVLTGGCHPFDDKEGWAQMRELNIKKDKPINMDKLDLGSDTEEPMQLIQGMLAHHPENRPTVNDILTHPFFWPPKERLSFLCDVSDHFEREPRDPPSADLEYLESFAADVIDKGDFLKKLPKDFVDTLGKQRKYTGGRMLDLLRALRNKRNHYEDLPEEIKRKVGAYPVGYLQFWTTRFPKLLMACDGVVKSLGLEGTERFRDYYSLDRKV